MIKNATGVKSTAIVTSSCLLLNAKKVPWGIAPLLCLELQIDAEGHQGDWEALQNDYTALVTTWDLYSIGTVEQ